MEIVFYTTANDRSVVEEGLKKLSAPDRAKVYAVIAILEEEGIGLREPHCRHLGQGLRELRSKISRGQHRVLYFFMSGSEAIMVHEFAKKTQKTPKGELDLARKRKKDWETRHPGGAK